LLLPKGYRGSWNQDAEDDQPNPCRLKKTHDLVYPRRSAGRIKGR
jgi:hypothetical protein